MIKMPKDQHGNEGWLVKARKFHRCESHRCECKHIEPGDYYYRAVAWPGDEVNGGTTPWIIKICRACLYEPLLAKFDALVPQPHENGETVA